MEPIQNGNLQSWKEQEWALQLCDCYQASNIPKKKKKKAVCQELDKESISINILEVVGSWIYWQILTNVTYSTMSKASPSAYPQRQ